MNLSVFEKETHRYSDVGEKKSDGATFTPSLLADFVADEIINNFKNTEKRSDIIKLLDPAIGDGELVLSLLKRLESDIDRIEVYAFETNANSIERATDRLLDKYPDLKLTIKRHSFLDFVLEHYGNGHTSPLFQLNMPQKYDLIIANPPYVRTQILGAQQAKELAQSFELDGRVDLYYPFILGMGRVLNEGGIAGIIVSNRFMTTKSGTSVRKAILNEFELHHVWDLGDTKIFDAAVLPAVVIGGKGKKKNSHKPLFSSIYQTKEANGFVHQASDVIRALKHEGLVEVENGKIFNVKHGSLAPDNQSDVWSISNQETDDWLQKVEENMWGTFRDVGKIRVGVKTCADKVFIRNDWSDICGNDTPELLKSLTTHHIARRFKPEISDNPSQILYTHECVNGKRSVVDIDKYPASQKYLVQHREQLEGRKYVREAGREWYEIWVPQNPDAWKQPKLIFRDISEKPTFWLDFDGSVVNGDCYWMIVDKSEDTDLLWLAAAVANSSFIEEFYDHKFNNKLYAGRRRFITQYVEKFPMPDPSSEISSKIVSMAKDIYQNIEASEVESAMEELDLMVRTALLGYPNA